jgi:hypothetical protein
VGRAALVVFGTAWVLSACVDSVDYEGRSCSELAPCPDSYVCSGEGRCVSSNVSMIETCSSGQSRPCGDAAGAIGRCKQGSQTCTNGTWATCTGEVLPESESCNGIDDDCDGTVDEDTGAPLSCGVGACARSVASSCEGGQPASCIPGSPSNEVCNGIDDDCDGETDEGLGDSVTCGVGACQATAVQCSDATAAACTPRAPSEETCNGVDDDCNGLIDEGLPIQISCGLGECRRSIDYCTGGVLGTCVPGRASSEVCNGLDDDCDGQIDEDFGGTITCGTGECRRTVTNCDGGGVPATCAPGAPSDEVCNGLDDDCDDVIDEGLDMMLTCGAGACARSVVACISGTPRTCTPGSPSAEACNGIDDDCDGTVDEGFQDLTCGVGACRRTMSSCEGGIARTCTPGPSSPEVCNAIDDDCDGSIDEDFNGTVSCGMGECRRTVTSCSGGTPGACVPGEPGAEACNGLDDDCNGTIDDNLPAMATCGVGECARSVAYCVNGSRPQCTPGQAGTEICDGLDNDCDGASDEWYAESTLCTSFPAPIVSNVTAPCADGNCMQLTGSNFGPYAEVQLRLGFGTNTLIATIGPSAQTRGSDPRTSIFFRLTSTYQQQLFRTSGLIAVVRNPREANSSGALLVRQAVDISWSYGGPIAGQFCTQILEASDPDTWNDNYLCARQNYGFRWSSAGPIAGLFCVQWDEPADPETWNDNFLCMPNDLGFRWSYAGPIAGLRCVQITEPSDPHTWTDNYLCF